MRKQKFGLVSLGCAKNLVDSEVMMGILKKANLEMTEEFTEADVLIVNTCGFISSAKEESINTILDLADYKKDQCRLLVVTGCLVQKYSEELAKEIPEIDILLGTSNFKDIVNAIETSMMGEKYCQVTEPEYIYDHNMPRHITTPKHSAYIKVAEGCSNCCSYCAIPQIRGSYRSRPMESVLEEAKSLVNQGAKELMLIAQDTTSYGIDLYGELKLVELIKEISKLEKLDWIRILYCYPTHFTDELIEEIASNEKICKYLDIPIQHCNDNILKAMNRKGNKEQLFGLLTKLRHRIPNVILRTSLIVGFPGETDQQYQELVEFVKSVKFDRLGVFTYSQEEDTKAGQMAKQIDESEKELRYNHLMEIQQDIAFAGNQKLVGSVIKVLIEEKVADQEYLYIGRSQGDAPEVDNQVYVRGSRLEIGQFYNVKIVEAYAYDLIGEVKDEPGE